MGVSGTLGIAKLYMADTSSCNDRAGGRSMTDTAKDALLR